MVGTVEIQGDNKNGRALCHQCGKSNSVEGIPGAWEIVKHWAMKHQCEEK